MNVTHGVLAVLQTYTEVLPLVLHELVATTKDMQAAVQTMAPQAFTLAAAAGCVALPLAARFLLRRCRRSGRLSEPESILPLIHFYSGRAYGNNMREFTSKCKDLLRANPHMVNQPIADNSSLSHGYTPFLRACWNNNYELIKFMLDIGASTKLTNNDGEGALYLVAYRVSKSDNHWDPRALNLLWEAGCSVDDANIHNNTMLHLAAKAGHDTLVRWLLLHGAEPDVTNHAGYSPHRLALKKGSPRHIRVAQLLMPGVRREEFRSRHVTVCSDGILMRHRCSQIRSRTLAECAAIEWDLSD